MIIGFGKSLYRFLRFLEKLSQNRLLKRKANHFLKQRGRLIWIARSLDLDSPAGWSKEYQNRKLLEAINAAHSDLPDKEDLFLQEKIRDKQRELVENEW